MRSWSIRLPLLAALIGAACLSVTAPAQAGSLVATATSCDEQVLEQPFLQWSDSANYFLAPGGAFETGAEGWTLSDGAAVVDGNEPWNVHGAGDAFSLSLPAGSSATSRAMCVGIAEPTLRFFARRDSAAQGSNLKVEVLYEDADGNPKALPIQQVNNQGEWWVTKQAAIVVNWMTLQSGERTAVAFRFTPQTAGTWRIDDVYVDPWRGR